MFAYFSWHIANDLNDRILDMLALALLQVVAKIISVDCTPFVLNSHVHFILDHLLFILKKKKPDHPKFNGTNQDFFYHESL